MHFAVAFFKNAAAFRALRGGVFKKRRRVLFDTPPCFIRNAAALCLKRRRVLVDA